MSKATNLSEKASDTGEPGGWYQRATKVARRSLTNADNELLADRVGNARYRLSVKWLLSVRRNERAIIAKPFTGSCAGRVKRAQQKFPRSSRGRATVDIFIVVAAL